MKDNELIAEFMGMKYSDERSFNDGEWTHSIKSLSKFETSWDWLMPVVKKCRIDSRCEHDEDVFWDAIQWALEECSIENTYDAVVKFIKQGERIKSNTGKIDEDQNHIMGGVDFSESINQLNNLL